MTRLTFPVFGMSCLLCLIFLSRCIDNSDTGNLSVIDYANFSANNTEDVLNRKVYSNQQTSFSETKKKKLKKGCLGRVGNAKGDISAIQEALRRQGKQIVVDGKMGARTIILLKRYQEIQGLPVTGKPDKATIASLNINSGEINALRCDD